MSGASEPSSNSEFPADRNYCDASAEALSESTAYARCMKRIVRIRGHYVRSETVGASCNRLKPGRRRQIEAAIWRSRPGPSSFRHLKLPLLPGIAGTSRRKPKPARPCTVARVVMNRTQWSDQAIALRRRSARMCRIDGLRRMAEMLQNLLDDCGFLDAGDDAQAAAALLARLDIDSEHPLEALCP